MKIVSPIILLLLLITSDILSRELTPAIQLGYGRITSNASSSPDGKYFILGSSDGKVRMWDVEKKEVLKTFSITERYFLKRLHEVYEPLLTG